MKYEHTEIQLGN